MPALGDIWFFLVGVLLLGYALLDGFDLGAGILHPFVARTDAERRTVMHSVGPVWDGNEVWLLTAGGALFAAFPIVYATVFSGFYLALILLLAALIFRAVALEFRDQVASPGWRRAWDAAFFLGSLLPPLLLGVAVGNIIRGIPLDADGGYRGGLIGLLTPFPLIVGLLVVAFAAVHGSSWLILRTEGAVAERARQAGAVAWAAEALLWVAATVAAWAFLPDRWAAFDTPVAWVAPLVAAHRTPRLPAPPPRTARAALVRRVRARDRRDDRDAGDRPLPEPGSGARHAGAEPHDRQCGVIGPVAQRDARRSPWSACRSCSSIRPSSTGGSAARFAWTTAATATEGRGPTTGTRHQGRHGARELLPSPPAGPGCRAPRCDRGPGARSRSSVDVRRGRSGREFRAASGRPRLAGGRLGEGLAPGAGALELAVLDGTELARDDEVLRLCDHLEASLGHLVVDDVRGAARRPADLGVECGERAIATGKLLEPGAKRRPG